jgi:hypothetical protein
LSEFEFFLSSFTYLRVDLLALLAVYRIFRNEKPCKYLGLYGFNTKKLIKINPASSLISFLVEHEAARRPYGDDYRLGP